MTTAVTLGKGVALASLVFKNMCDISQITNQADLDMFYYVKEIYDDLKKSGNDEQLVLPITSCSSNESVLDENDRFFVGHTLIEQDPKNIRHDRLMKHLNNCYECFQVYSQFYKDYYQAYQEIHHTVVKKNK